jgi:hypothetical protein
VGSYEGIWGRSIHSRPLCTTSICRRSPPWRFVRAGVDSAFCGRRLLANTGGKPMIMPSMLAAFPPVTVSQSFHTLDFPSP